MLNQGPDPDHFNPLIPTRQLPFLYRLDHLAKAIKRVPDPVKIVALGSSSTAGNGSVIPYPPRLEMLLRQHYQFTFGSDPRRIINVINRGKGGEDAPGEYDRLERDVLSENPAALIWQIGTNAAWKNNEGPITVKDAVMKGLDQLQGRSIDVVLMDPQFVPALIWPKEFRKRAEAMQAVIRKAAEAAQVNLFGRYDLMRAWCENEKIPIDSFVDPNDADRLHQNDWSTRRIAEELANLIIESVDKILKEPEPSPAPTS